MQIQSNLASTIAMAFDECPSSVADRDYMENSVNRTTRWLKRCKAEMDRLNSLPDTINKHQMLFGINQGGTFEDIRIAHADTISKMNCDGYAVGGLAVGESHEEMYRILDAVVPHLPEEKPTYLMGVGTPANILEAVDRGVDFFEMAVMVMYIQTTERSTCLMSSFQRICAPSKRDASVRPAAHTAGPISAIS